MAAAKGRGGRAGPSQGAPAGGGPKGVPAPDRRERPGWARALQAQEGGREPAAGKSGPGLVWAVVLAAGASSRMGFNKLLHPLGGVPVLQRVVRAASGSLADRTLVVLGCRAEELSPLLEGEGAEPVLNERWERGMLSSFQRGVGRVLELDTAPAAAMLLLGDAPLIRAQDVDALVRSWRAGGRPLALTSHEGRRGHPLLVAGPLLAEVLALREGESMRDLVRRHPGEVLEVAAPADALEDVDTPEEMMAVEGKVGRAEGSKGRRR